MSDEKNVVQCSGPIKHFYDANKYDRCPHCGAGAVNVQSNKKPHGLFGSVFGKNTNNTKTQGLFSDDKGKTANNAPKNEQTHMTSQPQVSQHPSPIPRAISSPSPQTANAGAAYDQSSYNGSPSPVKYEQPVRPVSINNVYTPQNSRSGSAVTPPDNDGKTTGHWYGKKNNDPVVGWLVCVKGENQGESYQIVSGRNSIGRRETNEIALIGENSVSRENHASVFYDYKKSEFYLKPGEGNSLPYVNDEMVTNMTKLNRYDVIEIGDCICVFVPFCGKDFSWDKYIEKE